MGTGTTNGSGVLTVTLTGSAIYSSSTSYYCWGRDLTLTTNIGVYFAIVSSSQFTVSVTASRAGDQLSWVCTGY